MTEKEDVQKEEQNKNNIVITTLRELVESHGMEYDGRFGGMWGKIVTGVDLSKDGGWALQGEFVPKNKVFIVPNNAWVVIASDYGSRKYHYFHYKLLKNVNGQVIEVEIHRKDFKDKVPPEQYVKALNSDLYAFAVYIFFEMQKEQTQTS
jgi:hypothetical protein